MRSSNLATDISNRLTFFDKEKYLRLVDWSFEIGFVAFVEGFGADDFVVAQGGREVW